VIVVIGMDRRQRTCHRRNVTAHVPATGLKRRGSLRLDERVIADANFS
jgi:hypothetical protein